MERIRAGAFDAVLTATGDTTGAVQRRGRYEPAGEFQTLSDDRGAAAGAAALAAPSAGIIRRRAAAVGIEGRVSGHSLRVDGAQSLAAGGASIVEMQTAGRWQSPAMPGHYARGQLAARGAVARVRYGRG